MEVKLTSFNIAVMCSMNAVGLVDHCCLALNEHLSDTSCREQVTALDEIMMMMSALY